jgi:hypothetical protein
LAVHLKGLSELVLDFDIEDIGFELPEIDFRIQSLDAADDADLADEFQLFPGFAVFRPGDLWLRLSQALLLRLGVGDDPRMTSSSSAPRRPPCLPTRLTM